MEKILNIITGELKRAFAEAGYPAEGVRAVISNRPDLCEYQCNGAMAIAKTVSRAPIDIAKSVAERLSESSAFERAEAAMPGFINLTLSGEFAAEYVREMSRGENFGIQTPGRGEKIIVDYGGPNVAKPLHIGHLRSAIIGESVKRICRFMGYDAIGDIHMGDWGLQMGQIIAELKERQPNLAYFDENYQGEYPEEPPFTISDLEEIYPAASAKCKEGSENYDEAFYNEAKEATAELQRGRRGYMAVWRHIMNVSVADLRKNYEELDVHFELWNGESDAEKYIGPMISDMKEKGVLRESLGALVADVSEEGDKKEIPPCLVVKSDGATLYATTDLATIVSREKLYNPAQIIYVVDKRQELHFTQVFRTARRAGLVGEDVKLSFLGFGTMNGKDGRPFKTRDGGVLRLETLIGETREAVLQKMREASSGMDEKEREETARVVALSALKYGDLSNQAAKDYIFDINKFTEFEGNTGPYILYTIVRIKSILARYEGRTDGDIFYTGEKTQKALMLRISAFFGAVWEAFSELAPHKICAYIYDLSDAFNIFYHDVKILSCENEAKRECYISLISLVKDILERGICLLGFSAPERM